MGLVINGREVQTGGDGMKRDCEVCGASDIVPALKTAIAMTNDVLAEPVVACEDCVATMKAEGFELFVQEIVDC